MGMKTPVVTAAQILSVVTATVGLLVTQGAIDNEQAKLIGGIASILVPFAWMIADAYIRNGRSRIAAAEHSAELTEAVVRAQYGDTPESREAEAAVERDAEEVATVVEQTEEDLERDGADRE